MQKLSFIWDFLWLFAISLLFGVKVTLIIIICSIFIWCMINTSIFLIDIKNKLVERINK